MGPEFGNATFYNLPFGALILKFGLPGQGAFFFA